VFFQSLFESNLKTKNIARDIIYYSNIESTNDQLWSLYESNTEKNLLVITDNQTAGRGRGLNQWFSQPGKSITCSFLLNPVFSKNFFNLHALLIPIAIVEGVKKMAFIELGIKWPNDIMYKNKKLGGILIESKGTNKILNIGIGLNVNDSHEEFNDDLKDLAISLKEIIGYPLQREPLLAMILNELNNLIVHNDVEFIINSWMKYCIHKNKKISFMHNNHQVIGVFESINNSGQAIINQDGEYIYYDGVINIL
jgi:BirA family biotin operon repressor/biotin-[acetyl-CoA-carboxylase] ligase